MPEPVTSGGMANATKRPGRNLAAPRPVESLIHVIRGQKVMLDRDLAQLYEVPTRVLNQAVRRNIERFPEDFAFLLSKAELENWRSQIVTSNSSAKMGLRRPPYLAPLAILVGSVHGHIHLRDFEAAVTEFRLRAPASGVPSRMHKKAVLPIASLIADLVTITLDHKDTSRSSYFVRLFWKIRHGQYSTTPGLTRCALVVLRNMVVMGLRKDDIRSATVAVDLIFGETSRQMDADSAYHALYALLESSNGSSTIKQRQAQRMAAFTSAVLRQAKRSEDIEQWREIFNLALNLIVHWYDTKPDFDKHTKRMLSAYSSAMTSRFMDGQVIVAAIRRPLSRLFT